MKKKLLIFILFLTFFMVAFPAAASYNPASRANNKFGIHILFTTEVEKAAKLVNSSGGDWGYITIPIQYNDRDIEKWQKFMDECARHHIIPIVRVATDPYYANTGVWRKPNDFDVVDFANFLDSLSWPTKNRYVLLFNEVNRYNEWGGDAPSPAEYADFVEFASDSFKSIDRDFFLIAGGLDNASPNDGIKYLDNLNFLEMMGKHNPRVFGKIDGFSSHSYPNPDFSEPPTKNRPEGTSTYKYELIIVEKYAARALPVFITETGWNGYRLPENIIASYIKTSMEEIWGKDKQVIAVTPFVLEAGGAPFDKFTFYKGDNLTKYGEAYKNAQKEKGEPMLVPRNYLIAGSKVSAKKDKISFSVENLKLGFSSGLLKSYFKSMLAIGK